MKITKHCQRTVKLNVKLINSNSANDCIIFMLNHTIRPTKTKDLRSKHFNANQKQCFAQKLNAATISYALSALDALANKPGTINCEGEYL